MRTKTDLRAHLAALVAGTAPRSADTPAEETLEVSAAIAECGEASLGGGEIGDEVFPLDRLSAPSALLPLLP